MSVSVHTSNIIFLCNRNRIKGGKRIERNKDYFHHQLEMNVPELFPYEIAKLFIEGLNDAAKRPVLILGAGSSIPSLPSA